MSNQGRGIVMLAAVGMAAALAMGQAAGPVPATAGRVTASRPTATPSIGRGLERRAAGTRPWDVAHPTSRPAARSGAASRPATSQPAMLRMETTQFDFGKVWDTETVKHTFEMTNAGSQAVAIRDVHTSCGCTKPEAYERQVAPGATWKLPIEFIAKGRRGKTSKTITVTTDDPGSPQVVFLLEGEITPRFDMKPGTAVNFGSLQRDAAEQKTLNIINQGEQAVILKGAKVDTDQLRVSLREVEAGRKYDLEVQTVPPLKAAKIRGKITVETDLKEMPELVVYAHAYVQPRISLMPQILMVPESGEHDFRRRFVVKAAAGVTIHVKDVKVSNPKVETKLETVREGAEYQIWVTVPVGQSLPAGGDTITITTDDAEMPVLTATMRPYSSRMSRPLVAGASQPMRTLSSQPAVATMPVAPQAEAEPPQ